MTQPLLNIALMAEPGAQAQSQEPMLKDGKVDEEEALDNWTDLVKPQRAGTGATTDPWQHGAFENTGWVGEHRTILNNP
jgi:hypothetical protein